MLHCLDLTTGSAEVPVTRCQRVLEFLDLDCTGGAEIGNRLRDVAVKKGEAEREERYPKRNF